MRAATQLLILTLPTLYLTSSVDADDPPIDSPTSVHELDMLRSSFTLGTSGSAEHLTTYLSTGKSEGNLTDSVIAIDADSGIVISHDTLTMPLCLSDNSEWVLDYFILREGYEMSREVDMKLKWVCSAEVDGLTGSLIAERKELIDRIQSVQESVEDVAYTIDDVDVLLDPESVETVTGGLIERHEELESLFQALDILWYSKLSQGAVEIDLRTKIAMYIASHASDFETKFSWVRAYSREDPLPLSRRSRGLNYSLNMEFFKILNALKLHVASAAPIIDELILYIRTRSLKIAKYWEMVEALDALIDHGSAFAYEPEQSEVFISHLKESLEYLVKYEGSIFM